MSKKNTTAKFLWVIIFILSIGLGYTFHRFTKVKNSYKDLKAAISSTLPVAKVYPKNEQEIIALTFTDDNTIQQIYQMLKDTSELFEQGEINYAVDGGSVIAIARNQGLIPWDDDVDLVILQEDEHKLLSLLPKFKSLGYDIIFDGYVYRIFRQGNPLTSCRKFTHPAIDVAVVFENKETGKIEYSNWNLRETFPKNWYPREKFFPLQKYDFGPLKIYGPNDPFWYITHYYGKDVMEEVKIYPRHHNPKHSNVIKTKLTDRLAAPALPLRPLEDRVK